MFFKLKMWCCHATEIEDLQNNLNDDVHVVSLRFCEPNRERAFALSRSSTMLWNLCLCSLFLLISSVLVLCLEQFGTLGEYVALSHDNQLPSIDILASCVMLAITLLRWIHESIGHVRLEVLTVVVVCYRVVAAILGENHYWAKFRTMGENGVNTTAAFSDTRLRLVVVGFMSGTSLLLPIRWCVQWPIPFLAILSYAFAVFFLMDSGRNEGLGSFLLIALLAIMLSIGKRWTERLERTQFAHFLKEKALRFEAEHLANTSSGLRNGKINEESEHSVPTTTATGVIFHNILQPNIQASKGGHEITILNSMEALQGLGRKEQWIVETDEIELLPDVLGKGGFGMVVRGKFYGAYVAVKIIRHSTDARFLESVQIMATEIRILRHIHHPNIVPFHGAVVDPNTKEVGLVLEYIRGAPLHIRTRRPNFEAAERHQVTCEICCALRYLHSRKPVVVHGDIKTGNVLVEGSYNMLRAKLVDFGLARILKPTAKGLGGTLGYQAPEIKDAPAPTTSADVFSFGRLAYAAVTSIEPLADYSKEQISRAWAEGVVLSLNWSVPCYFRPACQALCDKCFSSDPTMRPNMTAVHAELQTWRAMPVESALPWQEGLDVHRQVLVEEEASQRRRKLVAEQDQQARVLDVPGRVHTLYDWPTFTLGDSVASEDITGKHAACSNTEDANIRLDIKSGMCDSGTEDI